MSRKSKKILDNYKEYYKKYNDMDFAFLNKAEIEAKEKKNSLK